MPIYAVELTFDQDEEFRLSVRPAHRAYLTEQTALGTLVMAGPYTDDTGALQVYDVPDRAALDAVVAADPYFAGDRAACTVSSVREWTVLDFSGSA